jgi:hypothetical protein
MTVQDTSSKALRRLRADVQSMSAYAVQDARGMIKLDAMENSHGLPAALRTALGERLARSRSTAIRASASPTCGARWPGTPRCPKASR